MDWAHLQGYSHIWTNHIEGTLIGPSTCEMAADYGQLDALKWLRAHGCDWDIRTSWAAAMNGHLPSSNGRERMGASGIGELVVLLPGMAISPVSSG